MAPLTRMRAGVNRAPLATSADDPGCHGSRGREVRVRLGARQVSRGRA